MESKLNFNAPLLSVRRYSTTAVASSDGENGKMIENSMPSRRYSIPFYRTELNLEQVTEPVAVPFVWEQIPGRSKDGGPEPQHSNEASVTPRLPRQRALDIIKYHLGKELEDSPRADSCSLNENVARLDFSKEGNAQKEQSDIENDDAVYSDAPDTLSPTDSRSINCSVSGLSGSDGEVVKQSGTFSMDPQIRDFMMSRFLPAAKAMALEPPQYASMKQPSAIERPRQVIKVVREDRRRIVNESIVIPHYGEDVEEEEESEDEDAEYEDSGNLSSKACGLFPRLCLNKSLCLLNPVPGLKFRSNSSASSSSDVRNLGKASYIESHSQTVNKCAWDAVYRHQVDSGVRSPKLLGIENKMTCGSSRFACLSDQQMASRSSPFRRGISPYRNERSQSPFRGGGFLGVPKEGEKVRADKLNSYNRPSNKSQELLPHHSFRKELGLLSPAVEKTLYVDTVNFANRHQVDSGVRSPKLLGIENKMTCGSNRFTCSSDQQMESRSSSFRRGISPYRNERPQSPFRGGGFLGVPKEGEKVRANKLNSYDRPSNKSQELLPQHSFEKGLGSLSPTLENTLYVETVNFAKISDTKGQMDSVGKNFLTLMKSRGVERTANIEASLEDANCPKTAKHESSSETKISGSFNSNRSSYNEKRLHSENLTDMVQCLRLDGELNQECNKSLVCINVTADENLNSSSVQKFEVDDLGYINSGSEQSPLPPPLPKKPSESWLWRTMPSVSSQNSFSNPNLGTQFNPNKQDPKTPSANTKWEIIVKTSHAHQDHMRYSEELTTHFSQQSKT